jgi:hypothetical protein
MFVVPSKIACKYVAWVSLGHSLDSKGVTPKSHDGLNCNIHVLGDLFVVHLSMEFNFCNANKIFPTILCGYESNSDNIFHVITTVILFETLIGQNPTRSHNT